MLPVIAKSKINVMRAIDHMTTYSVSELKPSQIFCFT